MGETTEIYERLRSIEALLARIDERTVRDLDMFEMRRRGMTRWASEEIVQ